MLGHLWKAAPGYVISSFFVTIIQGFIEIVISVYLFRYIINGIQTGISFYQLLLVVSVTLLGVFLAFCLLDWYNNVYLQTVNIRLSKYFDKLIFSKSIEIDLENYDNPEFYNKYAKAINETTGRATGVLGDLTGLISSITVIISLVTLLLTMDPLLIVFSVAPVVLTLPLSFLRNKYNYNFTNDVALENRKVNYYKQVLKEKEYAKEFRMSKVYEVLLNRYDLSMDRLEKTNHKYGIKRFGMGVWETFNQIGVVMYIPYIYLIYRIVVAGTLLIGDFVSMYNAVRTAEGYIRRIMQIAPKINKHCLFIDNLKDFLNMKKSIQGSNDGLTPERDINISIDNLSFQYTGNDNYVLKNIFMNIEHNQKIAIVGRNDFRKLTLKRFSIDSKEYTTIEDNVISFGVIDNCLYYVAEEDNLIMVLKYDIENEESIRCGDFLAEEFDVKTINNMKVSYTQNNIFFSWIDYENETSTILKYSFGQNALNRTKMEGYIDGFVSYKANSYFIISSEKSDNSELYMLNNKTDEITKITEIQGEGSLFVGSDDGVYVLRNKDNNLVFYSNYGNTQVVYKF